MQTPLTTREAWLTHFTEKYLWPRIEAVGGHRPQKYRVSVGFPKGRRGSKGHSIGQCWSQEVSADRACEIFVSPELDAAQAVAVLAHETIHASVGVQCGPMRPGRRSRSWHYAGAWPTAQVRCAPPFPRPSSRKRSGHGSRLSPSIRTPP